MDRNRHRTVCPEQWLLFQETEGHSLAMAQSPKPGAQEVSVE
jgi:hypothetical protein